MSTTAEHLLANRELLSLKRARLYLGSRQRVHTPFGASEYLRAMKHGESEAQENRVKIAIDCMEIYRVAFEKEYQRSTAPFCSLQREQELYALVHANCFPILRSENDLHVVTKSELQSFFESTPEFFLPYIPIRGVQERFWQPGAFDLFDVETEYQVALALTSEHDSVYGESWAALKEFYGLGDCPEPLPPLAKVGWSLFVNSCYVHGEPLCWLPIAFFMITYKTGNFWLDIPPIGALGVPWSLEQVMKMSITWAQALDMKLALKAVGVWLEHDPQSRIPLIVKLWNEAAEKEKQSGYAGMMIDEETRDWL